MFFYMVVRQINCRLSWPHGTNRNIRPVAPCRLAPQSFTCAVLPDAFGEITARGRTEEQMQRNMISIRSWLVTISEHCFN